MLVLSGWNNNRSEEPAKRTWKKLVQTNLKGNQSITYHKDGMPATISWTQCGSEYKKTFNYEPGKISYIVLTDGAKTEKGVFTIEAGQVSRLDWNRFSNNGTITATNQETFQYNEKGLLVKHQFNNSRSEYAYDEKDNLITVSHYNEAGKPTTIVEYTYTSIADQHPGFGFFTADGSGFFLPGFSKNLPASRKVTRANNGEVTQKGVFKYELDADGYVLKGKWDAVSVGDADFEWLNSFQ